MTIANDRGQMMTEAVLIMVVLMGMTVLVAKFFKDQEVLKQLVSGPWVSLSGVLQNGVWTAADRGTISHPSGHTRHITIQGESAR